MTADVLLWIINNKPPSASFLSSVLWLLMSCCYSCFSGGFSSMFESRRYIIVASMPKRPLTFNITYIRLLRSHSEMLAVWGCDSICVGCKNWNHSETGHLCVHCAISFLFFFFYRLNLLRSLSKMKQHKHIQTHRCHFVCKENATTDTMIIDLCARKQRLRDCRSQQCVCSWLQNALTVQFCWIFSRHTLWHNTAVNGLVWVYSSYPSRDSTYGILWNGSSGVVIIIICMNGLNVGDKKGSAAFLS